MAAFWLARLALVTLNIYLVVVFVVAKTDFCGSVFEAQVDHALVGHAIGKDVVADEFECQLNCLGNNKCKSFNVHHNDGNSAKRPFCELNNKTRQTQPGDFKCKKGSTYYGSVQVSCIDVSRNRNGKTTKSDKCHKGKQCQKLCGPVGVADRSAIPDNRMTASSIYDRRYYPYYGRLHANRGYGGWCQRPPYSGTDYLQVDMGTVRSVCGVATQGGGRHSEWTTRYKIYISSNGVTWNAYKENNFVKVFQGNTDQNSIVYNFFNSGVKARFIRIYPTAFKSHPALRFEIYVS